MALVGSANRGEAIRFLSGTDRVLLRSKQDDTWKHSAVESRPIGLEWAGIVGSLYTVGEGMMHRFRKPFREIESSCSVQSSEHSIRNSVEDPFRSADNRSDQDEVLRVSGVWQSSGLSDAYELSPSSSSTRPSLLPRDDLRSAFLWHFRASRSFQFGTLFPHEDAASPLQDASAVRLLR